MVLCMKLHYLAGVNGHKVAGHVNVPIQQGEDALAEVTFTIYLCSKHSVLDTTGCTSGVGSE